MKCSTSKSGDHFIVDVSGRLDATTAGEFEAQCDTWISQDEIHVLADMSDLEYISSAGLRSILTSAKKLRAKGGDLRFCCLQGMVAEIFAMSGFESMFKIFAKRQQATGE